MAGSGSDRPVEAVRYGLVLIGQEFAVTVVIRFGLAHGDPAILQSVGLLDPDPLAPVFLQLKPQLFPLPVHLDRPGAIGELEGFPGILLTDQQFVLRITRRGFPVGDDRPGLSDAAHRLSAILLLMIVFWMTEAIPLAATALLGPTLVVILGIAPARAGYGPFADPIIFLFIGSFILAEAMFVHRLDRRMAFSALASPWIGTSALRLVLVYAGVSAGLSMWMSNTATTAMFFPLGMAVVAELGRGRNNDPAFQRFAMAMMLVTSFAASIGGMATPVGTPPNIIGKGLLLKNAGIDISFANWMAFGVPLVIVMLGAVALWML